MVKKQYNKKNEAVSNEKVDFCRRYCKQYKKRESIRKVKFLEKIVKLPKKSAGCLK